MNLNLRPNPYFRLITLTVLILLASPFSARAQYYQSLEQGYTLKDVSDKDSLLEVTPAPDVLAAQAASAPGTVLNCLLELHNGSRLKLEQVYVEDLDPFFGEQLIVPPADWAGFQIKRKQSTYLTEAGQVFIGIGIAYEGDNEWGLGLLVSYLQCPDGSFREVSRHELGHEYIGSVFVLDANNDGQLDVIASWMTGAGAGGGVDLLTVDPEGSFSYFGDDSDPEDFASSLWSAHGMVELIDYDNDGDWELQTAFPLFFSAAGYYYRDIVSFNEATRQWAWDPDFAPDYYVAQDHFYAQLYEMVKELVANPEKFHHESDDYYQEYTCTIDGESYSLVPFVNDDGTPNPDWIEELQIFVEGGPEPVGLLPFNESSEA